MSPAATILTLILALIGAALTGAIFRRFRLPRVSGYLVFGMIAGPHLGNLVTTPIARDLQLVNPLAIALIALIAGLELNVRRLRARLLGIVRLGAIILLLMYATLLPLVWLAWPWMPIHPDASGPARLALTFLLTTIIVSFSPTVTIAVIADTRSRGPFSELSLALVVVTDLVLIILFSVALQFVRMTTEVGQLSGTALLAVMTWEVLGSVAFGASLGGAFALYRRYVGKGTTVAVLTLCVLLAVLGPILHCEPLLAALAAGLLIENVAPSPGEEAREAAGRCALPILLVFFMAAGASLQLDAFGTLGLTAAALSLARLISIRVSTAVAVPWSGVRPDAGSLVWMALVSQAGVTLGMTVLVAREFPGWGLKVQSLMIALIAIHELVGPVLLRVALSRAGEIGGMNHEGSLRSPTEVAEITKATC